MKSLVKSIVHFYDNHTSCKLYSVEPGSIPKDHGDENRDHEYVDLDTGSIPKDPGDESKVYDYVDLQSDITLQQSLAYQSSNDLCVNTIPNVCYGQLRSTS